MIENEDIQVTSTTTTTTIYINDVRDIYNIILIGMIDCRLNVSWGHYDTISYFLYIECVCECVHISYTATLLVYTNSNYIGIIVCCFCANKSNDAFLNQQIPRIDQRWIGVGMRVPNKMHPFIIHVMNILLLIIFSLDICSILWSSKRLHDQQVASR